MDFHNTLRKELIHLIIKNVLLNKSHPNYRTGTEFMFYLKTILATVDIHDYNVLDSIAINDLKNYLLENKIKAMEIFGSYNINKENSYNTLEELEKDLKSNLELLKSSYISNTKQEIVESLIINIIINKQLQTGKIEINYLDNNLIVNIIENASNNASSQKINPPNSYNISIEGIKEFGFLLLIPSEYKEKFSLEDIRKKLFSLWETICKDLQLSTREIVNNFHLLIESFVKRRENNVKRWLDNLTSSFTEQEIGNIKELNSILRDRWKICNEKCANCYYHCTKILGHTNEHDCGFDHKCHEKCQKCQSIKCEDYDNCNHLCANKESGHPDTHICSHFHQCNKDCSLKNLRGCSQKCMLEFDHEGNCFCKSEHLCDKECIYKNCSKGCKIICKLPINHKEAHICESNDHQCIMECSLKNKSIGCINEGICKFKLPHAEGKHNCGGDHKCQENCYLKELSKNCGKKCSLPYDHNGKHQCSEIHKCKEPCECKGKSRGCKENCVLNFGHKFPHDCQEKHFCKGNCYYKDKSRNCKTDITCILPYNHQGRCTCGTQHLCNKKCSIEFCKKICNLPFEHDGKNCNCKEFHKCPNICSLKETSKDNTCNKYCKLQLGHDGQCFCEKALEEHKCNKKCSNCDKVCSLNVGHKELCVCGNCNCQYECKYKDSSRNCKINCANIFGHEGEHYCEEKNHLCNQICDYRNITKKENGGCNIYCELLAGHESKNHLCKNPKEKHICNKECYLKDKKGCKISCSLPINHEKQNCLCSAEEDGHLCDEICSLSEKSRCGCNKNCVLPYNHKEYNKPCLCSGREEDHKCNKECSLKSESRDGCFGKCNLKAGHSGVCFCQNSPEIHICNKNCSLKDKSLEGSCNDRCTKNAGHNDECICTSKKHECKEKCKYKNDSREGCTYNCSKEAGHIGDHLCCIEPNKHKCNKTCDLKKGSRSGCNNYCNKIPLHDGEHLCDSNEKHLCKEKCDLVNKCSKGCEIYCSKMTGHIGNHDCNSKKHICKGICFLQNISRGCKSECILPYNHDNKCICSLKEDQHYCKNKCQLCGGDTFCEYKYNHKEQYHLCNREHLCKLKCNTEGYCEINTRAYIKEDILTRSYTFRKNKNTIEYKEETLQTFNKKQCILPIPRGKIAHSGIHKCQTLKHKCGFSCQQCTRLCELDYSHEGLHYCRHGHAKNATISTKELDIKLIYREKEYEFEEGETATIFTCTEYCKEQGRGHIHIINLDDSSNKDEDIENNNIKKLDNNLYGCKCKYFWESYLKFRFEDEFTKELKEDFNKCPAKCQMCTEKNVLKYCELKLWHEPEIPQIAEKYWISNDGHKFVCKHPLPCHTIFIIDKSGSMGNSDIRPSLGKLKETNYFDTRLGSVVEHILNYIKKRNDLNNEDIFSFIAFNNEAKIIFQEKKYDVKGFNEINFIDTCINQIIKYEGNTLFNKGLIKAKEILKNTDRKKYKPVIILFSDGGDENMDETIKIIEEVSILILIYS